MSRSKEGTHWQEEKGSVFKTRWDYDTGRAASKAAGDCGAQYKARTLAQWRPGPELCWQLPVRAVTAARSSELAAAERRVRQHGPDQRENNTVEYLHKYFGDQVNELVTPIWCTLVNLNTPMNSWVADECQKAWNGQSYSINFYTFELVSFFDWALNCWNYIILKTSRPLYLNLF